MRSYGSLKYGTDTPVGSIRPPARYPYPAYAISLSFFLVAALFRLNTEFPNIRGIVETRLEDLHSHHHNHHNHRHGHSHHNSSGENDSSTASAMVNSSELANASEFTNTSDFRNATNLSASANSTETLGEIGGFNISQSFKPSDSNATDLTRRLYESLHQMSESDGFLFGHQNDAAKGQNFRDSSAMHKLSDINIATGHTKWSAVYGFNMWQALNGTDLTHFVLSAFKKGAAIEFEWEAENPLTGGSANDCTGNPMKEMMPGGSANSNWTAILDQISVELDKYQVENISIPVMLRLFHENTGWWYWWGTSFCTAHEYKRGFQYTIDYLRNVKGHHNLLVVYAPSKPFRYKTVAFGTRYPGNDYVDIIGFDQYLSDQSPSWMLAEDGEAVVAFAHANNKVPALAETGFLHGSTSITSNDSAWWTDSFLKPIVAGNTSRIAYALTWTDYASGCYWIPLRGEYTFDGFIHMANSPNVIWLEDGSWTSLDYSNAIRMARESYGWSRRLDEGDTYDYPQPSTSGNNNDHGWWRC